MDFEEFFKKKRIDLAALKQVEPALFLEFEIHYAQMGEKSFDHTKKYWFNKLRRQFQLAPEVKTEKAHIANPLAEQTITESLGESAPASTPPPKLGFVPKFKAGNMPKPVVNPDDKKDEPPASVADNIPKEQPLESDAPKTGYQPRFKMKPKTETEESTPIADNAEAAPTPEEKSEAKPAYKPRFNMKNIPSKEE
jgi:hypothetical protein